MRTMKSRPVARAASHAASAVLSLNLAPSSMRGAIPGLRRTRMTTVSTFKTVTSAKPSLFSAKDSIQPPWPQALRAARVGKRMSPYSQA